MEKENKKSEGDLLYVGPAFVPVMRFKGKMYVEIRDFECCVRDIQRELENLSELNRKQSKAFGETMKDYKELLRDYMKLEEENKNLRAYADNLDSENDNQAIEIEELKKENKKLKEDNKRLREGVDAGQKLVEDLISKNKNLKAIIEHYKKFEEGKEKLEGMLMEEDTLQELRDIGEI